RLLGFVELAFLPIYGLLVWIFNSDIIRSQKDVMSSYALTEGHYVDTIQGIATLKATGKELFFESLNKQVYGFFQNKIFELGKLNMRFALYNEITGVVLI